MNVAHIFQFLKELKENNTKEWMDANKTRYKAIRLDFEQQIEAFINGIRSFDDTLTGIEAKNALFRINRDIRFSNDKRPYKENFGADMSRDGKKSPYAGYYFHLEPGNCFLAGGSYMAEPAILSKIRQEIDYNGAELTKIVNSDSFKYQFGNLVGDTLVRPPKGYEADNPYIELIKMKSFIAVKNFTDEEVLHTKFFTNALKSYEVMMPFIKFLNNAISEEENV